jgi:uncharacterized protein YbaA (DUF1428 family)
MSTYVDGFVLTIPIANRAKYKKMAKEAAAVWKQHGALDYKECRLDEENPMAMAATFPKFARAKEGEEVWFAFIVFASKAERKRINKLVHAHFEKKYTADQYGDMPFDMKRMMYAGFKTEVE